MTSQTSKQNTGPEVVNVQTVLNESPFSRFQWGIFFLCFLIVLLDGFDTAAIGFIAPSLISEWGIDKPSLAPVLSAALFGLAFGALGAGPLDRFFTVALPLARPGFITAAVLAFAHTVGEFGVVLMLGGNIPGVTRVVSVQIYDHVEAMEYAQAHWLAGGMVAFSFIVLMALHWLQPRSRPL